MVEDDWSKVYPNLWQYSKRHLRRRPMASRTIRCAETEMMVGSA